MQYLDLLAGALAGILLFLALQGVDILPVLFLAAIAGLLIFANKHMRSGTKSFASFSEKEVPPVTFEDIGGQDVAKNELCEALEFIKKADQIQSMGIRPLKGILLSGPPGTGKTLLAKAAARFTDSVFLAVSGSEFVEMYVGVGAQRVRQLFKQARLAAKKRNKTGAVIFIDEMEVLGGKRGQNHSHTEHDQTLNELLVQMDGLPVRDDIHILVIGATNRVDMLDTALLRPGRFDRQVKVDLPDKKGRLHILRLHTKNKPLSTDVSLEAIAQDTFGFSGAQLESVTNEAAILALREECQDIAPRHFQSAIEKVMMGEKLDKIPSLDERKRVAIHEAGHALVSELVRTNSVASVNVASRSNALGYVRQTQEDDIYLYTLEYLRDRIAVALAGAVAEEILLACRSTGAANDFKQAADMTKQIIFNGLSELGIVSAEDIPGELLHRTMTSILRDIEDKTRGLLLTYQSTLSYLAQILLEQETLSGTELRTILARNNAA
ncbi:peptidase m41 [Lucifera butyrica]|uniref:Peptidase m41 n=1 Tax=Lucifera butyrica TaxID=1351585 RepID=A0A498R278_9FIRM|nr:AAA family ATPase [Lucifera butyrica]VBB05269.1 peptidase m41 [Lucifera butyrica]